MADAQLRYGIRILLSGGMAGLDLPELTNLYHACERALNERIYEVIDLQKLYQDINQHCVGAVVRLKRAYQTNYDKELTSAKDLVDSCPKVLLSTYDYGERSLLAVKSALEKQLNPLKLPLPTRWRKSPSWNLDSRWGKPDNA